MSTNARMMITLFLTFIVLAGIAFAIQSWLHDYGERNYKGYVARTRLNEVLDAISCVVALIGVAIFLMILAVGSLEFVKLVSRLVVGE